MTPEELFADVMGMAPPGSENSSMMAANNESKPINENCPIRTGRKADPSITAKNEKGETVAFCCNGCKRSISRQHACNGHDEGRE